jgi:hypothetical protein
VLVIIARKKLGFHGIVNVDVGRKRKRAQARSRPDNTEDYPLDSTKSLKIFADVEVYVHVELTAQHITQTAFITAP